MTQHNIADLPWIDLISTAPSSNAFKSIFLLDGDVYGESKIDKLVMKPDSDLGSAKIVATAFEYDLE
jgi:hypothetical protein